MRLELSVQADSDLADILAFGMENWGPAVGSEYFLSFDRSFRTLCERPMIGPAMPALGQQVRSFRHRRHRIYYEADMERVLILRVLHSSRDVRRAFK